MKRVLIESPYRALDGVQEARNVRYLRAAMRDCLLRGEAPFASHGLYTAPGVLDDAIEAERHIGIEAGFAWGKMAEVTVVYTDLGVSAGMRLGFAAAEAAGRPIEYRTLPEWQLAATGGPRGAAAS